MNDDVAKLCHELRERQKLKYAGNCKCGCCQLVHEELLRQAIDSLERLRVVCSTR